MRSLFVQKNLKMGLLVQYNVLNEHSGVLTIACAEFHNFKLCVSPLGWDYIYICKKSMYI